MNELQLFRQGNDTLRIARLTKQTEAEVCRKMHAQRNIDKNDRSQLEHAEHCAAAKARERESKRKLWRKKSKALFPYSGKQPTGRQAEERS